MKISEESFGNSGNKLQISIFDKSYRKAGRQIETMLFYDLFAKAINREELYDILVDRIDEILLENQRIPPE